MCNNEASNRGAASVEVASRITGMMAKSLAANALTEAVVRRGGQSMMM